MFINIMQL